LPKWGFIGGLRKIADLVWIGKALKAGISLGPWQSVRIQTFENRFFRGILQSDYVVKAIFVRNYNKLPAPFYPFAKPK
jgi:hypothetical protein